MASLNIKPRLSIVLFILFLLFAHRLGYADPYQVPLQTRVMGLDGQQGHLFNQLGPSPALTAAWANFREGKSASESDGRGSVVRDYQDEQGRNVMINEFMASNQNTLSDENGEYPDWIELYNRASTEINLEGWYLTDNEEKLTKWAFPAITLPAEGYVVVFASGKDQADSELHTNFKLQANGEYLALVEPDGRTIAWEYAPQYPTQFADLSYGLDSALNERYLPKPTPAQANGAANFGPIIASASHTPALPNDDDDIIVTVAVRASLNSGEEQEQSQERLEVSRGNPSQLPKRVTLHYRVMFREHVELPMFDDGTHADGAADDGVYGALIPSEASTAGEMVRYYITAEDIEGNISRWPLLQDPIDDALAAEAASASKPEYFGFMIADPTVISSLPVLYWFPEDEDEADNREGTRTSVFYNGRFYDNVFVRLRGGSSIAWPKKSLKFDFNTGDFFQLSPDDAPLEEFNLNSTYGDESYIREALAWETYRDAGVPYSISFPMRLQQNGEFYSIAVFVEQPDKRYLERQGLDPNGALYKMTCCNAVNRMDEGVNKRSRLHEDNRDLQALVDGVHLPEAERTTFFFDHLNIPAVINYLAAGVIMEDIDSTVANYYLYRDTEGNGEWRLLPWDRNWTFGLCCYILDGYPVCHHLCENSDPLFWGDNENHLTDAIYKTPALREMYLRRVRSLMDELLQPPNTPADQLRYEQRLDQFLAQMERDVALDVAEWPFDWQETKSQSEAIERLKQEYFAARRIHLYETHGPQGSGIIPAAQPDEAKIEFGPITTGSGDQEEQEYFTLINPNEYAVDLSGWQIKNHIEYTFQPGTVIPAGGTLYLSPNVVAFRQRATSPTGGEGHFVQGNYKGRLSNRSGTLVLYNKQYKLVTSTTFDLSAPLREAPSPLAGDSRPLWAEPVLMVALLGVALGGALLWWYYKNSDSNRRKT